MGNPPFIGANNVTKTQKKELFELFGEDSKAGLLDYVSGWYKKASDYIHGTQIKVSFVSTNSISQGEQVAILWKGLLAKGINIIFAYRTFIWDSEANKKAHVHCIIIGFKYGLYDGQKLIFDRGKQYTVTNINPYLIEAENIFIERRNKPICNVLTITKGCQPTDGGNLIIEKEELEKFIQLEPNSKKFIKKLVGAREYINKIPRYCLWLVNAQPEELRKMPYVMERILKCKEMRLKSSDIATKKLAERPTVFRETYNPKTYIIIPSASSENRRYVPIGFLDENTISTNANLIIQEADIYYLGILISNVHMAWMRAVAGRLKSDYRYSKDIVYNNFPWCNPTDEQRIKIEKTAQAILDARALYPNSSLADLYDELTMPVELRKAHQENDKAVMEAYGFDWRKMTESDCVAELMKMYKDLIQR